MKNLTVEEIAKELAHEYYKTHCFERDEEDLTKVVATALAACAREEHKATCIICSVKRESCPRWAALERAAGESK